MIGAGWQLEHRLRRKADLDLARRALPGAAGQFAVAVLLLLTTRLLPEHPVAAIGLATATLLLGSLRFWLVLRMRRIYGASPTTWRRAMSACLCVSGLVWGTVSAVTVASYGYEDWTSLLLSIVIVGLSALGVVSMTPNFLAMCLYLSAILAPYVAADLVRGGVEGVTMAMFAVLLGAFLTAQGRQLNRDHGERIEGNLRLRAAKVAAERASRAKDAALAALRVSEENYRRLFRGHPHPMYVHDKETLRFLAVNDAAVAHYGYSREEFLNLTVLEIRPPEEFPRLIGELATSRPEPQYSGVWKHRKKDGTMIDVEVTVHELHFGERVARLVVAIDVTERERTRQLERDRRDILELVAHARPLEESMRKLVEMAEHQIPGLCVSVVRLRDARLHYLASSLPPAMVQATGGTATELGAAPEGQDPPPAWNGAGDAETDPFWRALRAAALQNGFQTCGWAPVFSSRGRILGAFAVCHREAWHPSEGELQTMEAAGRLASVAIEQHQLHDKLLFQAHHDALTGLTNRFLLDDRLQQALARAHRAGACVALLHIDLDRFKLINDVLGHAVGDALLKGVAHRLKSCVRQTDTLARVGGDEFTLVLSDLKNPADALLVAEQLLGVLQKPFEVQGHELFVSSSIGIAFYPQDATAAGALMRKADVAMYRAKSGGKNRFQCFAPEMEQANQHLELETDLHRALERQELEVFYQPLFETATGALASMEALLRWRHPRLGLVPPSRFIPLAEETSLIVPIGNWVLQQACRQLREWREAGIVACKVSVNVSPVQFARTDFLAAVSATLAETGLEPSFLELEITETAVIRDAETAARELADLRALGVSIAIDDFGTGYSSLSYLHRLPVDYVKIDQSFVREIAGGAGPPRLVQAIITMSHALGMKVTAEGIETGEQLAALRQLGCDQVQGFLLGRPLPRAETARLLHDIWEADAVSLAS